MLRTAVRCQDDRTVKQMFAAPFDQPHLKGSAMKTNPSSILAVALVIAASSSVAFAANDVRDPYENSSSTWTRSMQAKTYSERGVVRTGGSASINFATEDGAPYENLSSSWTRSMQAQGQRVVDQTAVARGSLVAQGTEQKLASRTITLDAKDKWITVRHLDSVKFLDVGGKSFVWQFGAPAAFPLKAIAPVGFDSGDVWVAVVHPKDHVDK